MNKKMALLLLAAGACWGSQGCTCRAWYEGLKERQRQECYQNPGQSEVQKCLDSVNSTTYDEYMRSRKDQNK
ncbi:MAG: hypothetical protein EHM75_12835 [Desulfobacteraceae bacterium]|nr:MAG: hypothetical protein EHM75_12835 [Desulfobacteraceae bacterium]